MDSNHDILSEIAGEPEGNDMTNNQLLQQIAENPSGGTAGKSQALTSDGLIERDTTVLVLGGGTTFTIEDPTADGHIMVVLNASAGAFTVTGNIQGTPDNPWNVEAEYSMVQIVSVDMTPLGGSGLTWFVVVPTVPAV